MSDEDSACRTVTIHLDGLERDAILHNVTKAMRDIGASEREIEGFSRLRHHASQGYRLGSAGALSQGRRAVGQRRLEAAYLMAACQTQTLVVRRKLCASRRNNMNSPARTDAEIAMQPSVEP